MHRSPNKLIKAARLKCEGNYTLTQEPVLGVEKSIRPLGVGALGPIPTRRARLAPQTPQTQHMAFRKAVLSPSPEGAALLRPKIWLASHHRGTTR
jgi:hypothetical protein